MYAFTSNIKANAAEEPDSLHYKKLCYTIDTILTDMILEVILTTGSYNQEC